MRYRQLPLDQIKIARQNIRKTRDATEMAELKKSISQYGLLQPILVFEIADDEYEVITGNRRFAVCSGLEWDTIPAMVTKSQEHATMLVQAQENLVREAMTLDDELALLIGIIEQNQQEGRELTHAELASIVGKSGGWVGSRLRLLRLPDSVRARVRNNKKGGPKDGLAFRSALEITQLGNDPKTQRALAAKVEKEGMSQLQVGAAVRAIRNNPSKKKAVLNANANDSSFDELTRRDAQGDKLARPIDLELPINAPDIVKQAFSVAYQSLLRAFDDNRVAEVEGDEAFPHVCATIAENACYIHALLGSVIERWMLAEKCGWEGVEEVAAAEVDTARVVSLQIVN